MKKIIIFLTALTIIISCSSNDDGWVKNYTFENPTEFDVIVKEHEMLIDDDVPLFYLEVPSGQTKTFSNEHFYGAFQIKSNQTNRIFNYKYEGNDVHRIYDFQYKVAYKISGTATSADLTYSTSSGGTFQETVNLPKTIGFSDFQDDFLYISAQNKGTTGNIIVEIFYEDNLESSDSCAGSYCIATASS